VKKVIIASTNPIKINTTEIGFAKMFPTETFEFEGISAKSGVSDQPMTEEETLLGATNRAKNASKQIPKADFWVGIEGGLEEIDGQMSSFAWVVIKGKNGKTGKGKTGTFFIPQKVVQLIKQGMELGDADDVVFKRKNSKQANGAVGILTNDVLTRTTYYKDAVIMALIPFKNRSLY
jgi:inosine/xanthosine triphosphatase